MVPARVRARQSRYFRVVPSSKLYVCIGLVFSARQLRLYVSLQRRVFAKACEIGRYRHPPRPLAHAGDVESLLREAREDGNYPPDYALGAI